MATASSSALEGPAASGLASSVKCRPTPAPANDRKRPATFLRRVALLAAAIALMMPIAALAAPPTPKPKASPKVDTPQPRSTPSTKPTATPPIIGLEPRPAAAPLPTFQPPQPRLRPAEMLPSGRDSNSDEAQRVAKLASAAFEKGDLVTATANFEKVLTLAPENPAARINLGLIAYRQKRFDASEGLLRQVVRTNPEAGLAWLILGIVYYEQDKLDGALAALAQAVWLEPKDARAHHYLGVAVGRRGWYSGAEDEMRKAIELQPDYAEAHYNLAIFYLQRRPPAVELARRHYQKSIDLGGAPDAETEKQIGQ